MAEQTERSSGAKFVSEHEELREAKSKSEKFLELKKRAKLPKDDEEDPEEEQLYIVRGDTVGDEDELFLDALARGSNPETQDLLARGLFLEMDVSVQTLIMGRLGR